MNNEANAFVQDEIQKAHNLMYQEIEQQVQLRTGGGTQLQSAETE